MNFVGNAPDHHGRERLTVDIPVSGSEYAVKFEKLLEKYPRADGNKWRGIDFHEATGGFVSKSYVTNLRKGRMEHPGIPKLKEIAEVMGFPFRLWLEPTHNWEMVLEQEPEYAVSSEGEEFGLLLKQLLESRLNPRTGERYTSEELSLATHGKLSEVDVDSMVSGQLSNPTRRQLVALSDALGVDPAYWFKRSENGYVFEPDTYDALKEPQNKTMLKRSLALASDDKELVMSLLEKLHRAEQKEPGDGSEESKK